MSYIILRDNEVISMCDYMCEEAIATSVLTVVHPSTDVFIGAKGDVLLTDNGTNPLPEGYSDVRSIDFAVGKKPDGKGGWVMPEPPPPPPVTSVLNWQLSVALAVKGVSFIHTDPSIAARWQYEPSFAIDGAVAKALQASLGYDDAQLQALFNEAAAIK